MHTNVKKEISEEEGNGIVYFVGF